MKHLLSLLMASILMISFGFAGPTTSINLIDNNSGPIYEATNFAPLVFLNSDGGRALIDDNYGPFVNGNISERNNNYAFEGEKIQWEVLVWDKNGVEKISDVYGALMPQDNGPDGPFERQVNCNLATQPRDGTRLSNLGYENVRRPNDQVDEEFFDSQTMEVYICTYTVEPAIVAYGQHWYHVEVIDEAGEIGATDEAESWFLNPVLALSTSGYLDFGSLGPGEIGTSTISIKNDADVGSGAEVIIGISGSDFYDPTSSGALCPTSNQLSLQPWFTYSAVQGANQVTDKLIPYGNNVVDADPIFSPGDGSTPNYSNLVTTSPGSEISFTMSLELPIPCNGEFTDGDIYLWAVAV